MISMNRYLTPREKHCLHWVAQGKSSWEIATILGVAESTINFHVANICRKLGVTRRQAAITVATQIGYLPNPESPGHQVTEDRHLSQ